MQSNIPRMLSISIQQTQGPVSSISSVHKLSERGEGFAQWKSLEIMEEALGRRVWSLVATRVDDVARSCRVDRGVNVNISRGGVRELPGNLV